MTRKAIIPYRVVHLGRLRSLLPNVAASIPGRA